MQYELRKRTGTFFWKTLWIGVRYKMCKSWCEKQWTETSFVV